MTVRENLLVTAMEECAEIQQSISKALRFGMRNHHPDIPDESNGDHIVLEYYQLCAVMDMLQKYNLVPILDRDQVSKIKNEKLDKVTEYLNISKNLGAINGPEETQ